MIRIAVGIDVSKKTLDVATTIDGEKIVSTKQFSNDTKGHKALHKWMGKQRQKFGADEVHYTMEATGCYSVDIHEFLNKAGEQVSVMNPIVVKSFSKAKQMRTKTDAQDAILIARYAWVTNPLVTLPIESVIKDLRALTRHREHLTKRKAQEENRLEGAKNAVIIKSIKKMVKNYELEIKKTDQEISRHIDDDPDVRKKRDLLISIPGIGNQLASQILSEMKGVEFRIKAQVAHIGLAPSQFTSGSSVRRKPKLCKMGNKHLRKAFYMPTLSAIQYNHHIRKFYHQLLSQGKHKMVAICACMRKLFVIALGVLRNETPYQEGWVSRRPDINHA